MPIYEYTCPRCGNVFEELVSMRRASEPLPCPSCGYQETTRNLTTCATPGASKSSGGCGTPGPVG
jgi:putative FmdB family regulatory protein